MPVDLTMLARRWLGLITTTPLVDLAREPVKGARLVKESGAKIE